MCGSWLDHNIAIGKDTLLRMKPSQRAEAGAVCVRYEPALISTNLKVMWEGANCGSLK